MMNLEEQSRLSYFKRIADIGTHEHISFVQHVETMQIFVKKELRIYDKRIYQYLMNHPSCYFPRIYECIEDDGTLILIEEYIEGATLESYVQKRGCFSLPAARRIMGLVCTAVGELHRMKPPFIHRDLKPSNIMIEKDGGIKIVDLNTAREYEPAQTRDTVVIGTEHYAAPEQYGFRQSDARTDIYALGVLMNYLLTGKYPEEEIFPGSAGQIIRKCICFEPSGRYQSVGELAAVLERMGTFAQEDGRDRSPSPQRAEQQKKHRYPYLPPGFRTPKIWKILLACCGYVFVFYLALTTQWVSEDDPAGMQRANCIGMLVLFLILIFFWFDYGNIWNRLPLMKQRRLRPLGFILYSVLIFLLAMFFLALIESFCF